MESSVELVGSEIHGFHTLEDLGINKIVQEAKTRWLRPNEVYAILCNNAYCFPLQTEHVKLPKGGTILLFDRKKLRSFRKDGHNFERTKNEKSVKESHEQLKVGHEKMIHVYYAHGQENPHFVRRCYWLLDKNHENIVLVHYRDTTEMKGSRIAHVHSSPGSAYVGASLSMVLPEESHGGTSHTFNESSRTPHSAEPIDVDYDKDLEEHERRLHELNTLEWDDLLSNNPKEFAPSRMNLTMETEEFERTIMSDTLQTGDSFGQKDYTMFDSSASLVDSTGKDSSSLPVMAYQQNIQEQVFNIVEVSPQWGFSNEVTRVIVIGYFHEPHSHIAQLEDLYCIFGNAPAPVERIQAGVFCCQALPHAPGLVNFYFSLDSCVPISQVLTFEYREPLGPLKDENRNLEEFLIQSRLAHLLFSTSKPLSLVPNKFVEEKSIISSSIDKDWVYMIESVKKNGITISQAEKKLFELILKSKLKESLSERAHEGCETSHRDCQGHGVLHLCAVLGYTWAVQIYSCLGLSLDFRDASGWTALHWASFYGRKEMVAVLLSEGADPSLVTDPTSKSPGGRTAADIAHETGHDGIAAYLAEKGLTAHFSRMSLTGLTRADTHDHILNHENLDEEELCLKDSLAAFRATAGTASLIQAKFREDSLRIEKEATQQDTEIEAIIAEMKAFTRPKNQILRHLHKQAIKIQAAFRGHRVRKQYHKVIWSVGVLEKAILRWRKKRIGFRGFQPKITEANALGQNLENDIHEDFFIDSRKQAEERFERSVVRVQALFRSYKAQQEYRKMKLVHAQTMLERNSIQEPGFKSNKNNS